MADEVDVPEAELFRERTGELGLEQPAPREQGLAETHPADPASLQCGVELVVGDPALLEQDRAEHRPDLVLEVAVVEARGRRRACGEPQTASNEALVHRAAHLVDHRLVSSRR